MLSDVIFHGDILHGDSPAAPTPLCVNGTQTAPLFSMTVCVYVCVCVCVCVCV